MDVIGNVKDEFVKPPNYSGPVMVGHLMFDADFEGGNLGSAYAQTSVITTLKTNLKNL